MLRFGHIEYLWILCAVPIIVLLFIAYRWWRRKALKKFGDTLLVNKLTEDTSKGKPVLKLILYLIAFSLLTIGAANPQLGTKYVESKREGVDVVIALDVSNSMKAQDIKPSRLERAKQFISRMIDKLENDRIGIIVFAGESYVQLPITSDYGAAKLFLSTIETDLIPTQGTAIGSAIDLSLQSYIGTDNKNKMLLIITDGENHEDDAVEAARKAREQGVLVHTIGMGTVEGAPIPIYDNGVQVDFMKDNGGNTVITKINQQALEEISNAGGGIFIRASSSDDGLNAIQKEMNKMTKKIFGTKQFSDFEDRYMYFLAGGLLVLLIEFSISYRQSKWLQRLNLFKS